MASNGSKVKDREPAPLRSRWQARSPAASSPAEVVGRRDLPRLALGVVVVLASGLVFVALYRSAGDRVPVLSVARDVGRYDVIERADLRSVLVGAEPGVELVPEADLDEIVGRVALTELSQGSLLSPDHVADADDPVVGDHEAVIGAKLGSGTVPVGDIPAGTPVMVVIRPGGSSGEGAVREVPGWLAALGERNPNSGSRDASLVVPKTSAADVAAAAAEDRIAVVSLEGG